MTMHAPAATDRRPALPWLTRALTAANVAVFAAMALAGADVLGPDPLDYIAWGSNFAPLTAAGEWWRLATAAFLHFGPVHLLFNAWALWAIGSLVERLFGRARFAAIYAVAAVGGSLASIAWNPLVNSAGASGAIFGLIGAQLGFFLRGGHRIPAEVIRAQRNGALGFIAYSVIFGFIVPGIDNAAHLGGLGCGFALGWLLARPLGAPRHAGRDRVAWLAAAAATAALLALGFFAADRAAAGHTAEQAYLRDWFEMVRAEPAVLEEMNAVMTGARDRRVGDAEVVRWLEAEAATFYRDAARRLESSELPAGSELAAEQTRTVAFLQQRAAALDSLAAGIRRGDRQAAEQAAQQLTTPSVGETP